MKRTLLFVTSTLVVLSFPIENFGQAPNLGSASNFALFTAVGAFENTGATNITGDIGTNAGAFTGFPPGTIVGQVHVSDSTSAEAATAVDAAYNYLNGITCDSVIGVNLGNGQILTPKVYCLGGAPSSLSGDLILDAQGDPNAIFIFKIDGALSTSALSNIILIDSASLLNVYWQINGACELGNNSIFKGNIIANGAINLLESAYLLGRGLSRQGAIFLNNNMVAIGMLQTDPLPIELISFTAHPIGVNVQIDWSTASETNNDYITIQRSKDGMYFEEVVRIQAAGNSSSLLYYSAMDYNPYNDISYYRLKQTDLDGEYTYSDLISIDFSLRLSYEFNIYPNPFSSYTIITIKNEILLNKVELRMYNVLGEEVMNTTITKQSTTLETNDFPSGIYFYEIINNNETIQTGKLISQK